MKTASIMMLFLAITLTLPLGLSGAQATNQTATNQTNSVIDENIGQQVSSFVHNATLLFKQQRNETLQAVKECHMKLQNATENKTQIIDECNATLKSIREKYQDARKQFQELFKQFREGIIILRHDAEGLKISGEDKEKAMRNIDEDAAKHGLKGIKIALGHVGEMDENSTKELENELKHVNETNDENNENSGQHDDRGMHGPPSNAGKSDSDKKD